MIGILDMSNYATLKTAIQQVIRTNGNEEITGALLQSALLAMVNSLGADYQFAGLAIPTTNPGTPDQNVFYFAYIAGTYSNFNSLVVPGLSILKYNGSWTIDVIFDYDITNRFQTLNLVKSKFAIQINTWYGDYNSHLVIPVNGGETVEFTQNGGLFYCAFLTSYETPVENAMPNFVSGYTGRQQYSTSFVIPEGTKFLIANNPDSYSLSELKINGVNVLGGVFAGLAAFTTLFKQTITSIHNHLSQIDGSIVGVITKNQLGYVVASKNIANKDNITDNLVADGGTIYPSAGGVWQMIAIPVTPGKTYTFGGFFLGRSGYAAFYNGTTFLSYDQYADPNGIEHPHTMTAPANATVLYIDIKSNSSPSNPYEFVQVNEGSTLLPYDEYTLKIKSIDGDELIGSDNGGGNLETLIVDLPVSDGTDILSGYAYIETSTRNVKVKS